MPIRIPIADDHTVVRRGLRGFLALDPDLEVVGEAADGAEAVDLARRLAPDAVLMDLLMSGLDGIAATRAIRRGLPAVEVLALTSVLEYASVSGAIRAGAIGYLLKTTDADELREAIRAAAAGKVRLAPEAAAFAVWQERRAIQSPRRSGVTTAQPASVARMAADGSPRSAQGGKPHRDTTAGRVKVGPRASLVILSRGEGSASPASDEASRRAGAREADPSPRLRMTGRDRGIPQRLGGARAYGRAGAGAPPRERRAGQEVMVTATATAQTSST